jgi:hypothetical protein
MSRNAIGGCIGPLDKFFEFCHGLLRISQKFLILVQNPRENPSAEALLRLKNGHPLLLIIHFTSTFPHETQLPSTPLSQLERFGKEHWTLDRIFVFFNRPSVNQNFASIDQHLAMLLMLMLRAPASPWIGLYHPGQAVQTKS